jgi:prepilin-type processing-associated H-X9-DG protein
VNPLTTTDAAAQDSWIKHIYPYIKKLEHFRCPGNNNIDSNYKPNGINDFSYTCNGVIAQFGGANTKRASETVVYCDDPGRSNMSVLRAFYNSTDPTVIARIKTGRYWTGWMRFSDGSLHSQMHDGGKSFGFMDGHVKYAKWQDVTSLWFQLLISRKYIDGQETQRNGYADDERTGVIKW